MDVRTDIRVRLIANNLSSTWLIGMLKDRGIVTDRASMSAILAGTRNGPKVDQIVETAGDILDRYEVYHAAERNATDPT